MVHLQGDLTIDCRKHGEFCTHVDTEEFIVLKNGWAAFKWQTTDRCVDELVLLVRPYLARFSHVT
eukprot:m.845545 g.845545  ORF g.845545 m.845545 type:complete len:65 (-) comp23477_c1_seq35:3629-3823(-)